MAAAGYSGTALHKKLGIDTATQLQLIHAPSDYPELLEIDIRPHLVRRGGTPSMVHLFAANQRIFLQEMNKLKAVWQSHPTLVIWVSWYKKSAGMASDMSEDSIRQYALANGLVDVKVCAVSAQWSGLKLVVPLSKR